jgi:hypothetical protein
MPPSGRNVITAAPCLKSRYLDSEGLGFQGSWFSTCLDSTSRHSTSKCHRGLKLSSARFRTIRVTATSVGSREGHAHPVQLSRAYSTQSCMLKERYTLFHRQKDSTWQKGGTSVYPSSVDFRSDADEERHASAAAGPAERLSTPGPSRCGGIVRRARADNSLRDLGHFRWWSAPCAGPFTRRFAAYLYFGAVQRHSAAELPGRMDRRAIRWR